MPSSEHTTQVIVEEGIKFGVFANAFRVVEEAGPDCFLDFMVYSAAERQATLVARIRVRRDFLDGIRDKMGDAIEVLGDGPTAVGATTDVIAYRKIKEPVH